MPVPPFDKSIALKYLQLPQDYEPSPETDPISFLTKHISQLPPHILLHYTNITTPKQRTVIAPIRNRRLLFANSNPPELQYDAARNTWPDLWRGRERQGVQQANEERSWVQSEFLHGNKQHVGKLAKLLADYEEEREGERVRSIRRTRAAVEDVFVPEEDSDSDIEDIPDSTPEQETERETQGSFERLIRENFIYGRLDNIDYDRVDWDESFDTDDDREAEERWFDEDGDED
ncbi:hypothetical protein B0H34DRAFT_793916 [Crassisporium funariophilum]|nr:hypothetical protein B0H34DRAFT_793916 [Crassisporium funariophilum]